MKLKLGVCSCLYVYLFVGELNVGFRKNDTYYPKQRSTTWTKTDPDMETGWGSSDAGSEHQGPLGGGRGGAGGWGSLEYRCLWYIGEASH